MSADKFDSDISNRTFTKTEYYLPMMDGSVTRVSYIGTVLVEVEEDCPVQIVHPYDDHQSHFDIAKAWMEDQDKQK